VFHIRRSTNECSAQAARVDQEPTHMLLLLRTVEYYFLGVSL
jgi:hypothetical protein